MTPFRVFLGLASISLLILVSSCTLGPEMGGSLKVSVPVGRAVEPTTEYVWAAELVGDNGLEFQDSVTANELDGAIEFSNVPIGNYELYVARSKYVGTMEPEFGPTEMIISSTTIEVAEGDNEASISLDYDSVLFRVVYDPGTGTGDPIVTYHPSGQYAILPSMEDNFTGSESFPVFWGWQAGDSFGYGSEILSGGTIGSVIEPITFTAKWNS